MQWDNGNFHPAVQTLLERNRETAIPLIRADSNARDLTAPLIKVEAGTLFPKARDANAALSGLLLLAGDWELSHETSQENPSPEGSYWHAIAHRIEPDASNAGYWFHRLGLHPVFPPLRQAAAEILEGSGLAWKLPAVWSPSLFVAWCEEARALPGSAKDRLACAIQQAEWNLLFPWCALKTKDF